MPRTEVDFFLEPDGTAPGSDWIDGLPESIRDRFIQRIERLRELGSDLRRPEADFLRDGIYELRVRHRRVNYRLRYFFAAGRAVISHGLTKERGVPDREIARAGARRAAYEGDPDLHSYQTE